MGLHQQARTPHPCFSTSSIQHAPALLPSILEIPWVAGAPSFRLSWLLSQVWQWYLWILRQSTWSPSLGQGQEEGPGRICTGKNSCREPRQQMGSQQREQFSEETASSCFKGKPAPAVGLADGQAGGSTLSCWSSCHPCTQPSFSCHQDVSSLPTMPSLACRLLPQTPSQNG